MKSPIKIVCFGEVLWDVFPEGKQIGGAPLNVALRLNSFGIDSTIISAVGNDDLGTEALQLLDDFQLNTEFIQLKTYPTGNVPVVLDENGSASYTITKTVAWDFISINRDILSKVESADAFIFGSLSCREKMTQETLFKLLDQASYSIFDINLRPPHFENETLFKLMSKADMIKFNDEEIVLICAMQDKNYDSFEDQVKFIAKLTDTQTICVTLGGEGALMYQNGIFYKHAGYNVKVVDTVGAGDSFLASLVFKLLNKETPERALNFACAVGALVASKAGANALIMEDEIAKIIQ